MLLYFINDSMDEYAKTSDDFYACLTHIGEDNFYGDYDNDDFRCGAQHLENIDGIDITCMDCNLFQKSSKYPPKILPKSIQKILT